MLVRRTDAGAVRVRRARLSLRLGLGGVPGDAAPSPASRLPAGLVESERFDPPLFSPATKAETGHDRTSPSTRWPRALGARSRRPAAGRELRGVPRRPRPRGRPRDHHRRHQVRVRRRRLTATLLLIDEVLTPDSSRFWPADRYQPGRSQPSFDKQPLRDYLAGLDGARSVERRGAAAAAPAEVVEATSRRYLEAFRLHHRSRCWRTA